MNYGQFSSPSSKDSSFRDHVHPSPTSPSISIGFRNFYLSKCLRKLHRSLKQRNYWHLFDSFKRIQSMTNGLQLQTYQRRAMIRSRLKRILVWKGVDQTQNKHQAIDIFQQNMATKRIQQIQIGSKYGIVLTRVGYASIIYAFRQIELYSQQIIEQKKQQKIEQLAKKQEKTRSALSKAVMAVLLRNFVNSKLMKIFEEFKLKLSGEKNKKIARSKSKGKLSESIKVKKKSTKEKAIPIQKIVLQLTKIKERRLLVGFTAIKAIYGNDDSDDLIFSSVLSHLQYLCSIPPQKSSPQKSSPPKKHSSISPPPLLISTNPSTKMITQGKQIPPPSLAYGFNKWRVNALEFKMPLVRKIIELQKIKQKYVQMIAQADDFN